MNAYCFDKVIERRGTGCVKWDESEEGVIPLWVADMDFPVAPAIQEAIHKRANHPVFGYTLVQDDYYEAIISWFHRRHQWTIARKHILYTIGVVPAMSVAVKALTMPGEKVLILSPDYNCFFSSVKNNGCEVVESVLQYRSNTNRFEVDWADFEEKCKDDKCTVFLLCNPHNPTGRVWTREELQRMADICQRYQVRIVSDEIHCELTMPGFTFCPMGTVDSTAVILKDCLESDKKEFIIATEAGILHEIERQCEGKTFYLVPPEISEGGVGCSCNQCDYMKMNSLLKIYNALRYEWPCVEVDEETAREAVKPINRMLELS